MNKLYYITAYEWNANEWWRFAVTADNEDDAVAKFRDGYSDMRFDRVHARYICPTTVEVFDEL